MHNDPYGGASHGPDVAFCVPVFHEGRLIGFSVTTAHHLDIGALTPGSCGIVDAIDAYAEGLQFKAIKVYEARADERRRCGTCCATTSAPPTWSSATWRRRSPPPGSAPSATWSSIRRYGLDTVNAAYEELIDYSERMMRGGHRAPSRRRLSRRRPTSTAISTIREPSRKDLPICVAITVRGSELVVDLTGTAPQVPDRPINMPLEGTVDVAIWLTLRSILLDSAVCGHIPQNSGLTRPITIVAPKGTLANPIFPAPTIARFCPGNQLADTVMKALAPAVPTQVSAGIGNLRVVAFSGLRGEQHWVHMEILEGSYGGRHGADGMDAVDTLYANTRNNPIEDIESHLPLRVEPLRAARGRLVAAGQWRGGIGVDPRVHVSRRRRRLRGGRGPQVRAVGIRRRPGRLPRRAGRAPGGRRRRELAVQGPVHAGPRRRPLHHGRAERRRLRRSAPRARPSACSGTCCDGYISAETAARDYGVVITADLAVDHEATARARSSS